ncbi:MAG: permease [Nitrospiraceae bacterium]|nr:MAG: permease [Nitrospiraceae bacterium]
MGTDKQNNNCELHGSSSRAANKTLLFMVFASFALIVWHVWVYGPSGHAVRPELLTKPFPVILGTEIWDMVFSGHGILAELIDVFPYFIIGILLAGLIRTYKLTVRLQRTLNRYGFSSIFIAAGIGIFTPLCACGTLTTAISLLFAGLPLAPVMALLVTSPLMSPSTYLLTLNDLGPEWTVIRTVAAFMLGIFAGVITYFIRNKGFQTESIFIEGAITRGDFHDENYPDERLRCGCKEKFGNRIAAKTSNLFVIFLAKSSEMLWLVGKYVLIGVATGAIVQRYMPYEWIYSLFGQEDPLSIIWITFGTIPIFLHQISASSILYHIKSSLDSTMNGGAGLAFLIGGPVTALPTMIMFWTIFRKRVFFLYMIVCLAGTIMIAYGFQYFVFTPHVDTGNPVFQGVRSISGGTSAVITKERNDRHVRVVMDPGGKGLIATYTNSIEGQGGVVFDSGSERFLGSAADRYDNSRYIRNIAAWLEENNVSESSKKILIYNAGDGQGFSRSTIESLENSDGFKVELTDRKENPEVSESLLDEHSQLWIFFGESTPESRLSDSELETITRFSDEGKSILIVSGTDRNRTNEPAAANGLASIFGVKFEGFVKHSDELKVSSSFHAISGISEGLERFYRAMK